MDSNAVEKVKNIDLRFISTIFYADMNFSKRPVRVSLRNWAALSVLLLVGVLLYNDPFLILWWPQKPAEVR